MTANRDLTGAPASVPGLVIRAISPDDASDLQAFHERLSADTVRRRYLGVHPHLPDAEARRLTSLGAGRETALVATLAERIIGVGRYIRLDVGDAAEVAFVIEDGYQGHGIGTRMLTLLAGIGWDEGIRHFVAETYAENQPMLDVFLRTPQAVRVTQTRREGDVICLTMAVTSPDTEPASASTG